MIPKRSILGYRPDRKAKLQTEANTIFAMCANGDYATVAEPKA